MARWGKSQSNLARSTSQPKMLFRSGNSGSLNIKVYTPTGLENLSWSSRRLNYMKMYGELKVELTFYLLAVDILMWRTVVLFFTYQVTQTDLIQFARHYYFMWLPSLYTKTWRTLWRYCWNFPNWKRMRMGISLANRPIFTYLTCVLNIGIFIFMMANSHIATLGVTGGKLCHIRVRLPNMTRVNTCWFEYTNPWVGPRPDELVRFGALYPPCVRFDPVHRETVLQPQRAFDQTSGCCILSLHDACYQTGQEQCRNQPFHIWINYRVQVESSGSSWSEHTKLLERVVTTRTGSDEMLPVPLESTWAWDIRSQGRASNSPVRPGPVCGLDPRFCSKYRLGPGNVWSNADVTKWPICEETSFIRPSRLESIRHMQCQVTAHPCCVGLRGECMMTTETHCKRIRGHYNPQAAICSQVNCLQKTCGMTDFRQPYRPDQLYRLITSLYLHAGFIHLWLTVTFQLTIMRTMETELGWFPICVIYILSGCFGNAVCILLLPYQVGIGPSPALISLIGVQLVNTIRLHSYAKTGSRFAIVCGFFLIGLMPWIENLAHIGGLISGMLFAFILATYQRWQNRREHPRRDPSEQKSNIKNNAKSKKTDVQCSAFRSAYRRVRQEYIVSLIWIILFLTLITLCAFGPHFYCTGCVYLSCLPLTPSACKASLVDPYKSSECVSRY